MTETSRPQLVGAELASALGSLSALDSLPASALGSLYRLPYAGKATLRG